MEFYQRQLTYHYLKKAEYLYGEISIDQYYSGIIHHLMCCGHHEAADEFQIERWWYEEKCPYYLVYPNIIPILTKIDLAKVPCNSIIPQRRTILLRFPQGPKNPLRFKSCAAEGFVNYTGDQKEISQKETEFELRSLLIANLTGRNKSFQAGFCVWTDIGELIPLNMTQLLPPHMWSHRLLHAAGVDPRLANKIATENHKKGRDTDTTQWLRNVAAEIKGAFPVFSYRSLDTDNEESLADKLASLPHSITGALGVALPDDFVNKMMQIAVTVIMIDSGDTTLLEPDILRDDELKLNRKLDETERAELLQRLQEKAERRGKLGWHLGRRYHKEYSRQEPGTPYVVPPHPCHFWVGPGRKQCILKTRTGWIANREKVTTVPTGHQITKESVDDPEHATPAE